MPPYLLRLLPPRPLPFPRPPNFLERWYRSFALTVLLFCTGIRDGCREDEDLGRWCETRSNPDVKPKGGARQAWGPSVTHHFPAACAQSVILLAVHWSRGLARAVAFIFVFVFILGGFARAYQRGVVRMYVRDSRLAFTTHTRA